MGQWGVICVLGGELAREGLKHVLAARGCVATARPLQEMYKCIDFPDTPDHVIIVDAATADLGIALCGAVRRSRLHIGLILICDIYTGDLASRAERVGIDRVVARSDSVQALLDALAYVSGKEGEKPMGDATALDTKTAKPIGPQLSVREIEILSCVANGDANKRIAKQLNISEATVKVHVKAILRKLHLANRTQAAIWAVQRELVSVSPTAEAQGERCSSEGG